MTLGAVVFESFKNTIITDRFYRPFATKNFGNLVRQHQSIIYDMSMFLMLGITIYLGGLSSFP